MPSPKILMSACLLGQKVRYDGGDCLQSHPRLQAWLSAGNVVMMCPEMAGGLPTPRPPAEIQGRRTGIAVLSGDAHIKTNTGTDVTYQFIKGAQKTLALAQEHHVRVAILKAKSPSCGSDVIYDGTFSRELIAGMGVTSALLRQHDILVFDEHHIDEALDAAERVK
jgi:uncharacterized protein YbbK (DUF523 family)